jgi:hypothetical protein
MRRRVRLVGGDRASGFVREGGLVAVAARADVVVVQLPVVSRAEQDEVVELCPATALNGGEVVCFELAGGGAARVLAVGRALVQRALLCLGSAAPDT